ncbi:MAG: HlyD family efflux transporter periplasmic adaptor subunit [Caldilineaceae bacterium]
MAVHVLRRSLHRALRRCLRPLLAAALAASLLGGCTFGQAPKPTPIPLLSTTPGAAAGMPRTLYTVQRGAVSDELTFPAKVTLANMQDLYFGAPGRVQKVYVQSGDAVKLDQVIAVLDTRLLELDRQAAAETLALARQRLSLAEATLRFTTEQRQIDLATEKTKLQQIAADPTADKLDRTLQELAVRKAELALQQLEAGVEPGLETEVTRSEIALRKVETALENAEISAPFAGQVLLYDALAEGQVVQAYAPVASLVDPSALVLEANLLPADLGSLQEGMAVEIALGSAGFSGTPKVVLGVVRTLPQPFGTGAGPTTRIVPSRAADIGQLRPGTTLQVSAQRAHRADALWLPPAAIQGYRDNYFVRLVDGSERPIEVGIFAPDRVEIAGGLQDGDQVVGDQLVSK